MSAITFDPSRQLDLYFRVNRAGSKTLTFLDADAAAYDVSSNTFQFLVIDLLSGTTLFTLTSGSGLTVSTNTITIAPNATQTNLPVGTYYWQLNLTNTSKTWLNGQAIFHTGIFDGVTETTSITISDGGDTITVTVSEAPPAATQAEVNTGTSTSKYVSPSTLQGKDDTAVALVDASSMALTGPKHTLSSSSATRTFTISFVGDDITLIVTLSNTAATYTFPAAALCVSEGTASGDNTCALSGVSGDKYVIAIKKVGSAYYVVCKNFGQ